MRHGRLEQHSTRASSRHVDELAGVADETLSPRLRGIRKLSTSTIDALVVEVSAQIVSERSANLPLFSADGNFRIPRKPGVERNDQIGHFDDMPFTSTWFLEWHLLPSVVKSTARRSGFNCVCRQTIKLDFSHLAHEGAVIARPQALE